MSLHSGKRIHGYNLDELPIDENVIERVESLAEEQGQPLMRDGVPNFEWTPGHSVEDLWDENLGEILAINPEAPLPKEPVAEDEASQVVDKEEPDMPINDKEEEIAALINAQRKNRIVRRSPEQQQQQKLYPNEASSTPNSICVSLHTIASNPSVPTDRSTT